ncbi:MAG: hypothetical protein A3J28_14665 [Acidobacteria bacterium RIFCSPLOWO2_12_FULL_60_22]|nr:MAG: hypothetical protein A3J28_14665 [Acidobacteria bacterium RIFCSPLOWO2_12_FULL_60_22]
MAEKHLIDAISKRFKSMSGRKRAEKIRKLASESSENRKFIKKTFPDLYQEAFPPSVSSAHP